MLFTDRLSCESAAEVLSTEGMMAKEIEKLWKSEDYWAIWFAAALFAGIISGAVTMVPKVGGWAANPLDAFSGDLGLWLALLGVGLRFQGGGKAWHEGGLAC